MIDPLQEFLGALFVGLIAFLVLLIAKRKRFFSLPDSALSSSKVSLLHVLGVFGIYFLVGFIAVSPIVQILRFILSLTDEKLSPLHLSVWAHLAISGLIALSLGIFCNSCQIDMVRSIWKNPKAGDSYVKDISIGALAWLISFPLVLCVSQFLDLLIWVLFHVRELPDQTAVQFLKMTMNDPLYFVLNIISIVGFAPIIEEIMFRGFLQTYARKFFSPKGAIWVSSICFSLFHFSKEQGLGNISIIGSLLVLAYFLGFVYERQRSLLASITLHATFNALSVVNLYFLGGTPRGPL